MSKTHAESIVFKLIRMEFFKTPTLCRPEDMWSTQYISNSNQVFNNLLIYRTPGSNIKSVTISINKDESDDIMYAPFMLFGGSVFLTGTIGNIDNTLKTGDVTIEHNDNGSIGNVKFSNFPLFANAVIIIHCKNIKNAIVKEEK